MHPLSIEYVLIPKQTKNIFFRRNQVYLVSLVSKLWYSTTKKKPSAYHTLGHLSLASFLDLFTLSSFQLILAHFESVRARALSEAPCNERIKSYFRHTYPSLLHAQHEEDITTLLVPHYVHSTCHNLQRHTEHMIRTYVCSTMAYIPGTTIQKYSSQE